MNILIIGSNGKVGKLLVKILMENKFKIRAMVRSADQIENMKNLGTEPFLADLEEDFSGAFENIDVVIFTAGSGAHTGPDKTIDIDQNAAIQSVNIAKRRNIIRYIMVSAQGAREPEVQSRIQHYYKAKRNADDYLINSGINYTIFRPGRLTDEKGTGKINASEFIKNRGTISRENLAKAIAVSITKDNTTNKVIEILEGTIPIQDALNLI